ncbi:unnamed protein product [Prunus armeniaca]|uniref:Uncharacterized protein n=1 Tax=Prunus armeniaca TaxID=36596 RepID=A0A6J5WCN8_PRUAR|nr:unnamed protein product [Prunus armeniaca]
MNILLNYPKSRSRSSNVSVNRSKSPYVLANTSWTRERQGSLSVAAGCTICWTAKIEGQENARKLTGKRHEKRGKRRAQCPIKKEK